MVVNLIDLCIGKHQYGIRKPITEHTNSTLPVVRITDIDQYGILNSTFKEAECEDKGKYLLHPNDLLIARTGETVGKSYLYDLADGERIFGSFLIRYRINPERIDPAYLRYYTLSDRYYSWIDARSSRGTAKKGLSPFILDSIPVPLFDKEKQREVVSLLNPSLELIKTKRKIIGKSQDIADKMFLFLFDDKVKNDKLRSVYQIHTGAKIEKAESGPFPVYTSSGKYARTYRNNYEEGCVLVPRKGSLQNLFLAYEKGWASEGLYKIQMENLVEAEYLYMQLRFVDRKRMDAATGTPTLNRNALDNIPVHKPSEYDLILFEKTISPWLRKQEHERRQLEVLERMMLNQINLIW